MAVLPILDYTHPALRARCASVPRVTDELRETIRDMKETMKAAPGVGLAAPQVGVLQRVLVYQDQEGQEPRALINPEIVRTEGEEVDVEGCLSIPGIQGDVPRALRVTLKAINERNKPVKITREGYAARILQHEIDHLQGVLFIDRAIPETLHRVTASSEEEPVAISAG